MPLVLSFAVLAIWQTENDSENGGKQSKPMMKGSGIDIKGKRGPAQKQRLGGTDYFINMIDWHHPGLAWPPASSLLRWF